MDYTPVQKTDQYGIETTIRGEAKSPPITLDAAKDRNGHYTMENFLKLMKGEYEDR